MGHRASSDDTFFRAAITRLDDNYDTVEHYVLSLSDNEAPNTGNHYYIDHIAIYKWDVNFEIFGTTQNVDDS